MKAHVSSILLAVEDVERARRFYAEGLGWQVAQDYGVSVFFTPDGGSPVGFYGREGLADQVGTSPAGSGFGGLVLAYVVRSEARVDEIIGEAERAGATVLKPAGPLPRGVYGASFADPDGYIWSLRHSAEARNQRYSE